MEQLSKFVDRNEEVFYVTQLTKELAEKHLEWLVRVHNYIPYQEWPKEQILADRDDYRVFHGKWELSRLAFNPKGRPIGFCIGFELSPDGVHYSKPGIYMHRMSLEREYLSRHIGAILNAEAIARAFERGILEIEHRGSDIIVYGQTNDVPENRRIIQFYFDAGFKVIGEKIYPNRRDVILGMTKNDFFQSRHAELLRRQRRALP